MTEIGEIGLLWLCITALLANFHGYPALLALIAAKRFRTVSAADPVVAPLPHLSIIICVWNEERLIFKKLDNLISLRYPKEHLEIIVSDGGSTDKTLAEVRKFSSHQPALNIRVVSIPTPSKVLQINNALTLVPSDAIVIVTDADAVISPDDALLRTASYLSGPCDVLGGWAFPDPATHRASDVVYWHNQNMVRHMESLAGCSSIVTAPFYAFRRSLLNDFPANCIADDVYISFLAHLANKRIHYASSIMARELRGAAGLGALFLHKLRKAHAYSFELFRFASCFRALNPYGRLILTFKSFQFFVLPWLGPIGAYAFLALLWEGRVTHPLLAFGVAASVRKLAKSCIARVEKPLAGSSARTLALEQSLVINGVLLANILAFPLLRFFLPKRFMIHRAGITANLRLD